MVSQRMLFSLIAAAPFMLMAGQAQAKDADRPAAVEALEEQGLTVMQEFEAGKGLRAFAGVAGDRPVAVYVLSDGNAIVGTRLNAEGEPIDVATLQDLDALTWVCPNTLRKTNRENRPPLHVLELPSWKSHVCNGTGGSISGHSDDPPAMTGRM